MGAIAALIGAMATQNIPGTLGMVFYWTAIVSSVLFIGALFLELHGPRKEVDELAARDAWRENR